MPLSLPPRFFLSLPFSLFASFAVFPTKGRSPPETLSLLPSTEITQARLPLIERVPCVRLTMPCLALVFIWSSRCLDKGSCLCRLPAEHGSSEVSNRRYWGQGVRTPRFSSPLNSAKRCLKLRRLTDFQPTEGLASPAVR